MRTLIASISACVLLQCRYASNIENKRIELFEGPNEGDTEENVLLASGKYVGFFISIMLMFMYHNMFSVVKVLGHFISLGVTLLIKHTLYLVI